MTATSMDTFVARFAADGEHEWSVQIPSGMGGEARDLAVDDQGALYLTGVFQGTLQTDLGVFQTLSVNSGYVMKLSADNGQALWLELIEPDIDATPVEDLVLTVRGETLYVAASYGGRVGFDHDLGVPQEWRIGSGQSDVLLLALRASDGALEWAGSSDGPGAEWVRAIATEDQGGQVRAHIVGQYFYEEAHFGPVLLDAPPSAEADGFRASCGSDSQGWEAEAFSSPEVAWVGGISVDADGGVCVSGLFGNTLMLPYTMSPLTAQGPNDLFVFCELVGSTPWPLRVGNSGVQDHFALAADPTGQLHLLAGSMGPLSIGDTVLENSLDPDPAASFGFVTVLDRSTGEHEWSRAFQSIGHVAPLDIAAARDDVSYVTGLFDGTIDLGHGQHDAVGVQDVFLARIVEDEP
jgi:outer membrane protein assembly factor BamB